MWAHKRNMRACAITSFLDASGGMKTSRMKRARRYAGWVCSILGIALVFLGLSIYLNGPERDGTTLLEYEDSLAKYVQPNEFVEYPYQSGLLIDAPSLILHVQTNASVRAREGIKAYFMNETRWSQIRNDGGFSEKIEEYSINLDNISFEPRYNVTYYIILTNVSNETVYVPAKMSTFYTIQVFDHNLAFNGLKSALIGGVMFAVSFTLENPFDKLLRKGLTLSIFPDIDDYLSKEKGLDTEIPWGMLGIMTLLIVSVACYKLYEVSRAQVPWPLISLTQDLMIRLNLFLFFGSVLTFAIFVLIVGFCYNVLRNCIIWLSCVKDREPKDWRPYNRTLNEEVFDAWLKEIKSSRSCIIYIATAIVSLVTIMYTRDIFIPLAVIIVPLILFFGYNLNVSYWSVCKDNKEEFEKLRFFIHINIVVFMVIGSMFIAIWILSWDLFLDTIYAHTIGSSMLVRLTQPISEMSLNLVFQILNAIKSLREGLIALLVSFWVATITLFLFLYYSQYPTKTYKAKRKILFREGGTFLFTFISVQLILIMSKQSLSVTTPTAIVVSAAVSLLEFFLSHSWKHILANSRTCPNPKCKKELSSFPQDTSFCPYCGEILDLHEK